MSHPTISLPRHSDQMAPLFALLGPPIFYDTTTDGHRAWSEWGWGPTPFRDGNGKFNRFRILVAHYTDGSWQLYAPRRVALVADSVEGIMEALSRTENIKGMAPEPMNTKAVVLPTPQYAQQMQEVCDLFYAQQLVQRHAQVFNGGLGTVSGGLGMPEASPPPPPPMAPPPRGEQQLGRELLLGTLPPGPLSEHTRERLKDFAYGRRPLPGKPEPGIKVHEPFPAPALASWSGEYDRFR